MSDEAALALMCPSKVPDALGCGVHRCRYRCSSEHQVRPAIDMSRLATESLFDRLANNAIPDQRILCFGHA